MSRLVIEGPLAEKFQLKAEQQHTTVEGLLSFWLEESAADPVALLELVADALVLMDTEGIITMFSTGAERLFGYTMAEAVGQPLDILLPPTAQPIHSTYVTDFIKSSKNTLHMNDRHTVTAQRKGGSIFFASISLVKVRNGVLAMIRDVTYYVDLIHQLEEHDRLLTVLTDNIRDVICMHEPDGRYLYVNQAIKDFAGYAPEEVTGTNFYDYIHPDHVAEVRSTYETALSGQSRLTAQYRYRCKDDSYLWVESTFAQIYGEGQTIRHLVTVSRDITEQKRIERELREERDLLSSITEMSPVAIAVLEPSGKIILANRRAGEVLGIHESDITKRTYNAPDWKHTDYEGNPWPDEKQPFVQVMKTRQPVWDIRHAIEKPDGERAYLVINGTPIFDEDGEISRLIFTVEDYTRRKLQQDELEASLKRERQLNNMKSSFVSMVSHEFRTPMTVIMTATGILRMKYRQMTDEQIMDRLHRIEAQIDRLDHLITDVTFINKAELVGVPVKISLTNIHDLISETAAEVQTVYPDRGPVRIIGTQGCPLMELDPALLQKIITNLLSNALKYSDQAHEVELLYRCESDQLTVQVTDHGIGIPEEDQEAVFATFHRARNVGMRSGTGLGLAIVRQAVDALNGTVTFESKEGQGTRFTVIIPVHPQS